MKPFTDEDVEIYIQSKVERRHYLVSKAVEEVQKIIQQLTAEISYRAVRFQAISNSGIHNENIKVLAPSQFLITVPLRGLTGYRECQVRHWRYYTVNGSKLLSSVRDPEELHQWLEVEQFSKSLQQWHEKDVNIEGDLVPAKVLILFRELVEKSIVSCNLSSEFGGDWCKGNHHTHKVFGLHGQKLSKTLQIRKPSSDCSDVHRPALKVEFSSSWALHTQDITPFLGIWVGSPATSPSQLKQEAAQIFRTSRSLFGEKILLYYSTCNIFRLSGKVV